MSDMAMRAWERTVDELHLEVERLRRERNALLLMALSMGINAGLIPDSDEHAMAILDDQSAISDLVLRAVRSVEGEPAYKPYLDLPSDLGAK